ncbi:Flagellar Member 4 [Trypanosoma cruzi]|uniref:Flagellar Member 4 n=1 Tax=Trypanosoma cruzi TaxID=5693 RepID=A0A2V2W7P2_TRYCR|nr:Flagellar Member 4 [Trypanosoma cruzi]
MNSIHALLELGMQRRNVERESRNAKKENGEATKQRAMGIVSAIEAKQQMLLRSLAQRFVYPASEYPPTTELAELSDVFTNLLRDVVEQGKIFLLYNCSSDACEARRCTCAKEGAGEVGDCSKGRQRGEENCRRCSNSGRGLLDVLGRISAKVLHESHAGANSCVDNIPLIEQWDAELQAALHHVGDVVSQAHTEMLVVLDALSDGRFPYLTSGSSTKESPPLWTEIVRLFEDAFESVLTDVVRLLLWCIHQHLLGRGGLAARPLFAVKSHWSYSASSVVTCPLPSELHERLMRRWKKELIWIVVPEFRLSQMTKRSVPMLGRVKRPMLRTMFMEDSANNRLWEALHYATIQRCDELQETVRGLTNTYSFYFSHEEEYYPQLGAQRLRELVNTVRSYGMNGVKHAGAGAFVVQTEVLQQVALSKLEPALKSALVTTVPATMRGDEGITVFRWKALIDVKDDASPAGSLRNRLNAFRAGRKVLNKYDKGLEPLAHTQRFLEEQRAEVKRMCQGRGTALEEGDKTQAETKQSNGNGSTEDNKRSAAVAASAAVSRRYNNRFASSSISPPILNKLGKQPLAANAMAIGKKIGYETTLPARVLPSSASTTTQSTHEEKTPPGSTSHVSPLHPQSGSGRKGGWNFSSGHSSEVRLPTLRNYTPSSSQQFIRTRPASREAIAQNGREEQTAPVMSCVDISKQSGEEQKRPASREAIAENGHREQPTPVATSVSSGVERDFADDPVAAEPDPLTANSTLNSPPKTAFVNAAAAESAKRRVLSLKKVCPFLPEVPFSGIFLEDLNLTDPRVEAAMNRMRAVRGNASVTRDYRSIALVEDSLCAVVESIAEEMFNATSRMLSRYPFLESRVRGVLLGNIPELETDEDIQSLLMIRRDAERARRSTASIDKCLRERAEALINDIPYVVEPERCSAHPFLLAEPSASSATSYRSRDEKANSDGDDSRATQRVGLQVTTPPGPDATSEVDKTPQAETVLNDGEPHRAMDGREEQPRQSNGQEQPMGAVVKPMTTGVSTSQPLAADPGQKVVENNGELSSERPCESHLPQRSSFARARMGGGAPACSQTVVQATEEKQNFSIPRVFVADTPLPAGRTGRASEQVQLLSSKPPVGQVANASRENPVPPFYRQGGKSFSLPLEEKQGTNEVVQRAPHGIPTSNNIQSLTDFSIENQKMTPCGPTFGTVRRFLESERQELERLESILGGVRRAGMGLKEGKGLPKVDAAKQMPSEEVGKRNSAEGMQQAAGKSQTGLSKKTSLSFSTTPNVSADGNGSVGLSTPQPAAARRECAQLGLLFEQLPYMRRSNEGNELLRKLIEERRRVSEAHYTRERDLVALQSRQLKRSSHSPLPMRPNFLAEVAARSSLGAAVPNGADGGQARLLPSLSQGPSHDSCATQQQQEQQQQQQQQQQHSYGNQRSTWGRYTIERNPPTSVTVQRRLSGSPGLSQQSNEDRMRFPTISVGISADHISQAPDKTEYEKSSNNHIGMSHKYMLLCRQAGIKPNSMLLRALPDTQGVSVSRVDTSGNYIGPKGLMPLLQVLRDNTGLKYLNLSHNNLENDEVIELVSFLMNPSGASLQSLDLSDNPVSLAGGAAILRLAQARPSLLSVRLRGTLVPQPVIHSIEEVCDSNRASAS